MNDEFPYPDAVLNSVDSATGAVIYDQQKSYKKGAKGNFVDPTPYFFCRQRIVGANCVRVKLDYEIYQAYANPPGWYPGGYSNEKWIRTPTILDPLVNFSRNQQAMVDKLKPLVTQALYKQVGKELEDFDLLTEVAEVRQTASLIHDAAQRLTSFTLGVLKRKPKLILSALGVSPTKRRRRTVRGILNHYARQRGRVEDAAGDIWLRYRYGFTPLIGSVNEALRALSAYDRDKIVTRSQATIPDSSYVVDDEGFVATSYSGFKVYQRRVQKTDVSVRAYGFWTGLNGLMQSIRGTRLLDFVQTGWELVPLSFAVDWFYNLSAYLNSQRVDSRIQWLSGAFAIKVNWQEVVATRYDLKSSSPQQRISGGFVGTPRTRFYRKSFAFKREPFSTPSSCLALPSLDLSYTWKRKVDSVFLLMAQVKGRLARTWHY